jgi:hypothetical protein
MISQQGISGEYGEEAPIQNSSPDLLEKVAWQGVHPPTFGRSGGPRTAVIVTAVLYIAGNSSDRSYLPNERNSSPATSAKNYSGR